MGEDPRGESGSAARLKAAKERRIAARAASSSAPGSTTGAEGLGLSEGDEVRHAKWGDGVVLDITGDGDKAEATIRFPQVGEKRLLLSWAPLEKVGA